MARQPPVGQGLPIVEASRSHSDTPHSVGPLWRACQRRYLYLTTHNTHKRQTFMPPAGFETAVPASERQQTRALTAWPLASAKTQNGSCNYKNMDILTTRRWHVHEYNSLTCRCLYCVGIKLETPRNTTRSKRRSDFSSSKMKSSNYRSRQCWLRHSKIQYSDYRLPSNALP